VLVSGGLGGGLGKGKGKLTSAQREKKRQKRHRYRERKRLERKVERMEKASESSNSVDTNEPSQQMDTKIIFRHKKLCKKDKPKLKVAPENEESKIEPDDSSLLQCNDINSTKLQTNSEEMSSSISSNTTEELPNSRVSSASYAENTTSGDDPSSADDANMFPTSESVTDTDIQHQTKQSRVIKTVEADLLPSTSSSGVMTVTETHTDS